MKKLRLLLWQLPLAILIIWGLGLALYLSRVDGMETTPAADMPTMEAIIVWTGGPGRIESALTLLKAKKAEKLLISGVHPDVQPIELQTMTGSSDQLFMCCVDLDRAARNTLGNARESTAWARGQAYTKLYLVTADYHMPRSLIVMRRAMPEAELTPLPVRTEVSTSALVKEYNKYLFTLLRIVG